MLAVESTVTPALQLITFQAADTSNWRTSRRGEKTLITRDVSFPPFIHKFSHFGKILSLLAKNRRHFIILLWPLQLEAKQPAARSKFHLRFLRPTPATSVRLRVWHNGAVPAVRSQRVELEGGVWSLRPRGKRHPGVLLRWGQAVTSAGNLVHHQRPVSSRSALTEDR